MGSDAIPCPFVYANGKRCTGFVRRARAYGPTRGRGYVDREDVRKYRLWCSEKDDHAGFLPNPATKNRMEFYPDEFEAGVEDRIWAGELLG